MQFNFDIFYDFVTSAARPQIWQLKKLHTFMAPPKLEDLSVFRAMLEQSSHVYKVAHVLKVN